MKKFVNILICFCTVISSFLITFVNVYASASATIEDSEGVNVRSGPGTNYSIITALANHTSITLVDTTKHQGTGCSSGWYQINYNGSTDRYVCSETVVVSNTGSIQNGSYYTTNAYGSRINEDYATVRTSPDGSKKELIYLGTNVKVLETTAGTASCTSGWAKISYYNNRTGYICGRLVSTYESITASDAEYNTVLRNASFPESYWPFLTYLHKLHPNWVFKAIQTGKDFNTAVNSEVQSNYIQSTESNYIIDGNVRENPNWYAANASVVAFYLDPRNYLTERNIFAFENLNYDSTYHTVNVVKNIFAGSFLAEGDYASYFVNAGATYNVSPIHLATRIKQEGSLNKDYAAVNGLATTKNGLTYNGQNLDGVYNFFNIGAYQDTVTSSAVTRGLAVAKGLVDSYSDTPWNTPQKSINAGARLLGNAYISKGQYTLYFEKFNTSPTAVYSSYTNQYMTNIIAPAGESLSTYYGYSDLNLLDTAFVFSIPVYNNMPTSYTSHPIIGDVSNDLSELTIDNVSITGFDKDVIEYNEGVSSTTQSVTIGAKTASPNASITGTGVKQLTNDITKIDITVTSQIGVSKVYTINIEKIDISNMTTQDIIDKLDVKSNGTYISGMGVGTNSSTIIQKINKINPEAVVEIKDKDNKIKLNNTISTGDTISITMNGTKTSYGIAVKGDLNGDGKITIIDLLRVQKHILKYTTLSDVYSYAADTNYDSQINIIDLLKVQKHILGYIVLK